MFPPLHVVILAAGKGTRMNSNTPKVLQRLAGCPLLGHVVRTAHTLEPAAVHVVYGFGGEQVPEALRGLSVDWVHQAEQKGTGHAVAQALPGIPRDAVVLVLYGDVPLTQPETLAPLCRAAAQGNLALLTAELDRPEGYGRVVRSGGAVARIVEHKDANEEQRGIREISTGVLALPAARLRDWLARLGNDNVQGEYYLTDIVSMAVADGVRIESSQPREVWEVMGVNSKAQLAELERVAQRNHAQRLLDAGVTLMDPARFDLRGELRNGRDVVIDVNVVLEGTVVLGDGVRIGPNCVIRDCSIGSGSEILANCVLEETAIGRDCRIGPFAHLRPGNELADRVHVGNFVEVKKSRVGAGSKMNHLSYIGDSTVGQRVNIGAGTITCNYDGVSKHRTVIGDDAFIGSNTALVAPVTVGDGATIGAGSTITRDTPAGELTLGRAEQTTRTGWKRPQKKRES